MGVSNTVQQLSVFFGKQRRTSGRSIGCTGKKRCEYCCTESCGYIRLWNASSDRL